MQPAIDNQVANSELRQIAQREVMNADWVPADYIDTGCAPLTCGASSYRSPVKGLPFGSGNRRYLKSMTSAHGWLDVYFHTIVIGRAEALLGFVDDEESGCWKKWPRSTGAWEYQQSTSAILRP